MKLFIIDIFIYFLVISIKVNDIHAHPASVDIEFNPVANIDFHGDANLDDIQFNSEVIINDLEHNDDGEIGATYKVTQIVVPDDGEIGATDKVTHIVAPDDGEIGATDKVTHITAPGPANSSTAFVNTTPEMTTPNPTTEIITTEVQADCLVAEGFVAYSNQCFKIFETQQSWDASKKICEDNGLELAKPNDPVGLMKLYQEKNVNHYSWIGLRGTGSNMQWIRDGTTIASDASVWYASIAAKTGTNYCTCMMATPNMNSDTPYYVNRCAHAEYALCELVG